MMPPNMMQLNTGATLSSGSLAKATGVSPDTIRHYEKIGVLPKASRTEAGYRLYPESAVERVLVVQRALQVGFTLAELADVLKARDAGGAPCRRVFEMAHQKLKGIRSDILALKRLEKYMKALLSDWEDRMEHSGPGEQSHLLHSLVATKNLGKATNEFRRKK